MADYSCPSFFYFSDIIQGAWKPLRLLIQLVGLIVTHVIFPGDSSCKRAMNMTAFLILTPRSQVFVRVSSFLKFFWLAYTSNHELQWAYIFFFLPILYLFGYCINICSFIYWIKIIKVIDLGLLFCVLSCTWTFISIITFSDIVCLLLQCWF